MTNLTTVFERRFLFSVGRHFWNFIAVCGFTALATGGTVALESQAISKADRELLGEKVNNMPDFNGWMNSKCSYLKPMNSYTESQHGWMCSQYQFLSTSVPADRYCTTNAFGGKQYKSQEFLNGECQGYEWRPYFVAEYINQYQNQYSAEVESSSKKHARQVQLQMEMASKLGLGGLISAWGLGVIAVSSLYSALLAIERNTRKQE